MNGSRRNGCHLVGICAGLWQLVSSHVGLFKDGIIRNHWLRRLFLFYAAGGGKSGFIRSLAVNYSGWWAFFAALAAGLAGLR